MRFAFITSAVAARDQLDTCTLDAEQLAVLARQHDVVVFADHATTVGDVLRDRRVAVHVSPKRAAQLPEGIRAHADEGQAKQLLDLHRADPFDAVVYSSEHAVDWALYEPALREVPRGVAVSTGPSTNQRLVLSRADLVHRLGWHVWTAAGFLATSDFVVADAPLRSYGFEGVLPPRLATRELPEPARRLDHPVGLLAIVACHEDLTGYATLVPTILDRVPISDRTTLVVVHPRFPESENLDVRDLIRQGCPSTMERSVVLIEAREDGVAASFVANADALVCGRLADLAVSAVAARAERVPALVLRGSGTDPPDRFPADVQVTPQRAEAEPVLVPVGADLAVVRDLLDSLEQENVDVVIIHARDADEDAARIAQLPGLSSPTLAVTTRSRMPFGDAEPDHVGLGALGVGRSLWPSLRQLVTRVSSLEELIRRSVNLPAMESVRLLAVPGERGPFVRLDPGGADLTSGWVSPHGMLPRPAVGIVVRERSEPPEEKVADETPPPVQDDEEASVPDEAPAEDGEAAITFRGWVKDHRWSSRARLALPWRLGLGRVLRDDRSDIPAAVREWVKDHRWNDRARLALPWKWGLLPKAMEERW